MTDLPNQTAIHVQAGKAVLGGFICYIAEPGFLYRSNGEFFMTFVNMFQVFVLTANCTGWPSPKRYEKRYEYG